MDVRTLIEALKDYPAQAHAVVAIVPTEGITIGKAGQKMKIKEVWSADDGVVNIIVTTEAGKVEPELRTENDL